MTAPTLVVLVAALASSAQAPAAGSGTAKEPVTEPCAAPVSTVRTAPPEELHRAILKAAGCLAGGDRELEDELTRARFLDGNAAGVALAAILKNPKASDSIKKQVRTLQAALLDRPEALARDGATHARTAADALAGTPPKVDVALRAIGHARLLCQAALKESATNRTAIQCNADLARLEAQRAVDAALDAAQKQMDAGLRDQAVLLARQQLAAANVAQHERALGIIQSAKPALWPALKEQFRAPWVSTTLAGATIAAGALALLFAVRRVRVMYLQVVLKQRAIRRAKGDQTAQVRSWSLAPILEEGGKLSAADVVLDALRRVPVEVSRDMWQPASILIPPVEYKGFHAGVWEDFHVAEGCRLCHLTEGLRPLAVDREKEFRDDFFTSFQSISLTTGTTPVVPLLRLFKEFYDWFTAGAPSLSGIASSRTIGTRQEISVRLSAGDPVFGSYTTVMASTEPSAGADALALSAERAAYKLLFRLAYPDKLLSEIEGRASLRQGLSLLAAYARAENGKPEDRKNGLAKALTNLDFAAQTLRSDGREQPWPEVLRFKAVASFLTDDLAGALPSIQQIEDTPPSEGPGRKATLEALRRESHHNHAAVLTRLGTFPNLNEAVRLFTLCLRDPAVPPDGVTLSAHLGRLAALAGIQAAEWVNLDRAEAKRWLIQSSTALKEAATVPLNMPSANRLRDFITCEADRQFAIAWSRLHFSERGQRRIPVTSAQDADLVNEAFERLQRWLRVNIGTAREYVTLAHLALMKGANRVARDQARKAIAQEQQNEFAHYLLAEATLQLFSVEHLGTLEDVVAVSERWKNPVTEPVLLELRDELRSAVAGA